MADEDDWEVAVDTGKFDQQLKQHQRDRAASEKVPVVSSSVNTDVVNPVKSNQPIRILKRPTSQSQVPSAAPMTSPFADQISSEDTVPSPTLIPRLTHRTNKAQIKTYEQRETEYRLARLRIMGEEESEESSTAIVQTIEETKIDSPATRETSTTRKQTRQPRYLVFIRQRYIAPSSDHELHIDTTNNEFECECSLWPLQQKQGAPVLRTFQRDTSSGFKTECSPTSSNETSTTSSGEELDFNLTFDNPSAFTSTNDIDTLLNESNLNEQLTASEKLPSQSSPEKISRSPDRSLPSLSTVPWNENNSALLGKASKKAVHFADKFGLDLESVRFMTPPERSSTEFCFSVSPPMPNIVSRRPLIFVPMCKYNLISRNFTSPTNIIPLIYEKHILLECLYTKDATAYGTIRVHNLTYDKYVFVRVTEDDWTSYHDIRAWHSMNHVDDNTDAFDFQLCLGRWFDEAHGPKRLVFVLCLKAMSQEYWDNNHNVNYVLDALEK